MRSDPITASKKQSKQAEYLGWLNLGGMISWNLRKHFEYECWKSVLHVAGAAGRNSVSACHFITWVLWACHRVLWCYEISGKKWKNKRMGNSDGAVWLYKIFDIHGLCCTLKKQLGKTKNKIFVGSTRHMGSLGRCNVAWFERFNLEALNPKTFAGLGTKNPKLILDIWWSCWI